MAKKMYGKQGKRVKSLTRDTSLALYQTCEGLIELSKELLKSGHTYVLLGEFTTDYLETSFGSIRQGSGGTYFITVQNVIQKLHIEKTRLLLHLKIDVFELDEDIGHKCDKCLYVLDSEKCDVFDALVHLENSVSTDVKMALVYIAGYVTRKDDPNIDDTQYYYQKFGSFLKNLDRGGLNVPTDTYCQWTVLCYIMFHSVQDVTCRKSLSKLFLSISEKYNFGITRAKSYILCNIFFKNYSLLFSPKSDKECALKVLKLK